MDHAAMFRRKFWISLILTVPAVVFPSAAELRRRASLPRHALRFVVLNLKILKLSRQHH